MANVDVNPPKLRPTRSQALLFRHEAFRRSDNHPFRLYHSKRPADIDTVNPPSSVSATRANVFEAGPAILPERTYDTSDEKSMIDQMNAALDTSQYGTISLESRECLSCIKGTTSCRSPTTRRQKRR